MKNKILLLISMIISSISFGQKLPSFGVKAGWVTAGIGGDALDNLNNLLDFSDGILNRSNHKGFFAGINTSIPISETFSLEPGIYFTQKGSEINGNLKGKVADVLGVSAKSVLHANFIDLPLLINADIGGLQIFAGPQVSYLTNAELKTSAGILGINLLNNSLDATSVLNRWDAGITGGVGYKFYNGISLTATYDQGLLKADESRKTSAYHQAFRIGIGFSF